jgi:hypothetical protein
VPNPTAAYITCIAAGVLLLLGSYPLHAATAYWLGLSLVVLPVGMPNVEQVVTWWAERKRPAQRAEEP